MVASPSLTCRPFVINSRLMRSINQTNFSEAVDRLKAFGRQEAEASYICHDYFSINSNKISIGMNMNKELVDKECRVTMCNWCYKIVDNCGYPREIVTIALSYADRYLCTEKGESALRDRITYQLVVITCLYLAIKINETIIMDPCAFVRISRGFYSKNDIEEMEMEILNALNWRLHRPTPQSFIQCVASMMITPTTLYDPAITSSILSSAHHKVELAVFNYENSINTLPSEIAFTAIILATMETNDKVLSRDAKVSFIDALGTVTGFRVGNTLDMQTLSHGTSVIPQTNSSLDHTPESIVASETAMSSKTSYPLYPTSPMSVAVHGETDRAKVYCMFMQKFFYRQSW